MGKGDQMEWFEAVDGYCERVDAAFWSEPINAVTNAAFFDCGDLGVATS